MKIENKKYKEIHMKRLTVVIIFLMLGLGGLVSADEDIGVFANRNTDTIQLIDPVTNTASDPILFAEFRRKGHKLYDVVITSDGKTAIVSSFDGSRVFFIDISAGFNAPPTFLGSARTVIAAEDLAITPDDKYVLVTDGKWASGVAVIEIATRKFIHNNNLGWRDAQALAITPDGQTVLVADYWHGAIHAYTLRSDGILIHKKTIWVLPFWPLNIAISPDGRTVIVVNGWSSGCVVLYFDSEGNLFYKGVTSLPASTGQSCIFSKDGTKAYYLSNSQAKGTRVHILDVTGVGEVSASETSIKIWPRRGTGRYFGVDTIALDPSENYLYVTNPTSGGPINDVALIDLTTNTQVGYIPGLNFPTGIAFATIMSDGEQ
jgi:DNA-binding beta-propeller fold protein YncE